MILTIHNLFKASFVILIAGLLFACDKNNDCPGEQLFGRWKLYRVLLDPGDGSGTFQNVTSSKFLEFHLDGKVSSNGLICDLGIESNTSSSAAFSLLDSTITCFDFSNTPYKIHFYQNGSTLNIYYPCDEPCIVQYKKN